LNPTPRRIAAHFVADDGERIHVWVSGEGPPMVLLHEWASSHAIWESLVGGLDGHFTVYRWDARGHGGHARSGTEPPTVGRMARDLAGLIAHFDLKRPVVVGHSMGALTLWEYIGRYGCGRLSRICVVDQSPCVVTDDRWALGIYGDWPSERDAAFVAGLETDFVETVIGLISFGKNRRARERYETGSSSVQRLRNYLQGLDPQPLIAIWKSLAAADYRPVLPSIDAPALLVYGSESNYYGVETGEYVRRSIPDARLVVYDGADHSPHIARPQRFVADLLRFANDDEDAAVPAAR
jgi:pimeloyl-ACP methyl ester carboxylesterase